MHDELAHGGPVCGPHSMPDGGDASARRRRLADNAANILNIVQEPLNTGRTTSEGREGDMPDGGDALPKTLPTAWLRIMKATSTECNCKI